MIPQKIILLAWIGLLITVPLIAASPTEAQVTSGFQSIQNFILKSSPGEPNVQTQIFPVLKDVINILLSLLAVLAVLAIVIGGVAYILSFGDENRAGLAKKIIWYAIIGLIIAILSALIINILLGFGGYRSTPSSGNEESQNPPPSEN